MGKGALGRTYTDGEVIVQQGDVGNCMFVIQAGRVEVFRKGPQGEHHLAFLEEGDFFGEMAMFEKDVRSATVRSSGESRVLTVDKKTLLRRIQEDPLLAVHLLERMSNRIRTLDARVTGLESGAS